MRSKYGEVFSGRIEFLLSPDDRYQPMSQKARQELWRKVQEMLEHIRELEKQVEEQKEELERTRRQFEEYRKRHPEMVGVKNGKAYIASIDRKNEGEGTGRKPGAQPGHPPHSRPVPAHIDDSVVVPVDSCPECGCTELGKPSFRTRIVEGIRRPRPYAVEYTIDVLISGDCVKT